MNSADPSQDYGRAEFDIRNRFTLSGSWNIPGRKSPGEMLEGWQINSVLSFQSGAPFNGRDSSNDLSGTGINLDRWTLVGDPSNFPVGGPGHPACFGTTGKFAKAPCVKVASVSNMPAACISAATNEATNPAVPGSSGLTSLANIGCYYENGTAIVPPAQGTYGTMGPYELTSQGLHQWDMSVSKTWKVKERYSAQFRFEVYNVINRTFYALPSSNIGSPSTFAQSQTTANNGNAINGSGGPRSIQLGLKLTY